MIGRSIQTVAAFALTAAAGHAAFAQQLIVLRSGEGNLNGPDNNVRRMQGSMNSEYPSWFTDVEFQAARQVPATIIHRNPAWGPFLPQDPTARWISTHADGGTNDGASALYAIPFHVNRPLVRHATIELQFMADNWLGGTWNHGVFINGVPLSGSTKGGDFSTPTTIVRTDIGPLLRHGENWLYINVSDEGGPSGLIFAATITIPQHKWCVDWTGIWPPDGQTWGSAYRTLQDALAVAHDGDEIWVARGTYKTTSGADRAATHQIKPGMKIYGGFDGSSHDFEMRNPAANPTFLSGDIHPGDADAYHVISGRGLNRPVVIDGFTIESGNANGAGDWQGFGGGLLLEGANVTHRVANCVFLGNRAGNGAGAFTLGGVVEFVNCAFSGNTTPSGWGGALQSQAGEARLINCTVVGNHSGDRAGGVAALNQGRVSLQNTILWGNTSANGAAQDQQMYRSGAGTLTIDHSCVQGLDSSLLGSGNTRLDPRFVDADGPDNVFGTRDDLYHLHYGTPAADAGNNNLIPAGVTKDLAGLTRRRDDLGQPDTGAGGAPIVDMGAVELTGSSCLPDFTNDFRVTLADFVAFRNAYTAGDPRADMNRDGTLTLADFTAYRTAYINGCGW